MRALNFESSEFECVAGMWGWRVNGYVWVVKERVLRMQFDKFVSSVKDKASE